jgi:hypothetical protein
VVDVLVAECWVGWWVAREGGAVDEMAVTTGEVAMKKKMMDQGM